MPPKKKRKGESGEEWKVQRGRRYQKKYSVEEGSVREQKGAGYADLVKENPLFEKYYQGQGFIPAEEWSTFISTLRESLPATFRITGTRRMANQVLGCLQKRFFVELASLEVEGEKVPAPFSLPWYPNNLAWNVALTKKFIRKSPLVSKFHTFLVRQSEQGNISRQEAVSMIPPLVLDVRPCHKVLDMCAAPGSKTAQLIEILHADDSGSSSMPEGVVVANDADNKRCYMLVHQAKRLNSPCLMVTNHDASVFPMLYYHDSEDKRHPVFYDRVLCDVPCSGDGTLRKNCTIWQSWSPLLGPALHKLQLRILNRGLELLCPGGRLVYSTCSLNPVEDEAIIATVLGLSKGALKLVDCSNSLAGLRTLPGRTSWKLMTKEGEWLDSYAEIPEPLLKHFAPSMFPPTPSEDLGLEKCIRVLPHHQDSGGFFIAVLVKEDWLPWQSKARATTTSTTSSSSSSSADKGTSSSYKSEASARGGGVGGNEGGHVASSTEREAGNLVGAVEEEEATSAKQGLNNQDGDVPGATPSSEEQKQVKSCAPVPEGQARRPSVAIIGKPDFKRKGGRGFKEDPYVFFGKNTDFFDHIKLYYGLLEDFPVQQLLTRTRTGKKKNIYFCSNTVRELTLRNENSVKIINIGVKVMSRCESSACCNFRLCQERSRNSHQPPRPCFSVRRSCLRVLPAQGGLLHIFLMAMEVTSDVDQRGVDSLIPYIHNHQVVVELDDLLLLLKEANPLVTSLSPQTQDRLQTLGIGPVVFAYIPPAADQEPDKESEMECKSDISSGIVPLTCPLHLSGWLAAKSARLFLDKSYRYNFLSLLGEDPPTDISLESMNTARRKALQAKQEAQQEGGGDVGVATSAGEVNNSEALPPRGEKDGESVATDEVMEVNQDVQESTNGSEGAIGDLSEEDVGVAKEMMAADTTKCDKKSELEETGDNVEVSGTGGGAEDGTEDFSVDNKYNRTNTEVMELDEGAHTC